jgi:hypothetical protein
MRRRWEARTRTDTVDFVGCGVADPGTELDTNVASCPPDHSEHDGRALHWPIEKTEEVRLPIGCSFATDR